MGFPDGSGIEVVVERLDAREDPRAVHESRVLLSDEERDRAERFAFDRDRNRYILARSRLRRLIATRLGMEPTSIELTYGEQGKPALAPRHAGSDLCFNVSHSNDVVAYVFARRREVGIDVEAIRAMPDADSIATRYFSRAENEAYLALDPEDKLQGFFNCWTRKEAFVKALGEGLGYPLAQFDVSLAPGEPARILRFQGKPGNACGWHLDAFCPVPGYVGAVVVGEG